MSNSGLRIRVDDQLKHRFINACKRNDTTAAQTLRAFMRRYVEKDETSSKRDLFPKEPTTRVRG